jgi:hypothetical protein
MTPYEELVAIVNGMGKEGKFVFIVDATHELTDDDLSKDIKNCQYQLFHFNMVEMTFAWLSRLIDECPDDTKSKMAVVLYQMERLVVHTAIEGSYEPTTVMRKILTPNGEISEPKLAVMTKRMLETVLGQAQAAGIQVEHVFDVKYDTIELQGE